MRSVEVPLSRQRVRFRSGATPRVLYPVSEVLLLPFQPATVTRQQLFKPFGDITRQFFVFLHLRQKLRLRSDTSLITLTLASVHVQMLDVTWPNSVFPHALRKTYSYRQSVQSATCPGQKSLQGHSRLNLGE